MTPAEIIELARAAARHGHRGPPGDYGRFPPVVSEEELAEYFLFDSNKDRRLIARRRRDSNRLGFALQLGTVRYLGRFLEDPSEVPPAPERRAAGATGPAGAPSAGAPPLPPPELPGTFVRSERKVGRNEPCPCGSGKKYKHCHGALSSVE